MLRVRIRTPTEPDTVREFDGVDQVSFGRATDNDIVLDSTYVSRRHGEFIHDAGGWSLVQRGSRAGVVLIRDEVSTELPQGIPSPLADGDELQIFHTRLEIGIKQDAEAFPDYGLPFVNDPPRPETPPPAEDATLVRHPPGVDAEVTASTVPGVEHRAAAWESTLEALLETCLDAIDAREPDRAGHHRRVARHAISLAHAVNAAQTGPWAQVHLSSERIHALSWAARLQALGRLCVPDQILQAFAPASTVPRTEATDPERALADEDRARYREYPEQSYGMLASIPWPLELQEIPDWVRAHCERLDGSGFPRGLTAGVIGPEVRILTLANRLATRSPGDTPSQSELDPLESADITAARAEALRQEAACGQLDPDLVELWLALPRPPEAIRESTGPTHE